MSPPTIALGRINLSFYQVVGAVVAALLERAGHTVTVVEGTHEQLYPRLGAGELDLFAAAWLPGGHGPLWAAHGRNLEKVCALYSGARFFFAVPASAPARVRSIGDLTERDADGFARDIQGLGEATGLTRLSRAAARAYGLDAAGFRVQAGDATAWRASVDAARAGPPRVLALWTPLFTDALDFRVLEDPMGAFGPADTAYLAAAPRARAKLDARDWAALKALTIPRADVSRMDARVVLDRLTPEAAAAEWLTRQARSP